MIHLQLLRRCLRVLGILERDQTPNGKMRAIVANCWSLAVCFTYMLSTSWYTLYTAKTVNEFKNGSVFALSSFMLLAWYAICLWYKKQYVELFAELDKVIEQSKQQFNL